MLLNAFSDRKQWSLEGFKDYSDFADCVDYVNQYELGDGQMEGEWYYCEDHTLTIYHGSFGNYNSPGADSCTYAERFDTVEDYNEQKAAWESLPEYVETENDNEESNDSEDDETSEDDYTTYDHCKFYQYGKLVLTVPEGQDYRKLVRSHMTANNFFPNVWFISDHGNCHLLNVYSDDE